VRRTRSKSTAKLMAQAMQASGRRTNRTMAGDDLRLIARIRKQIRVLKKLKGLGWEGDLNEMRLDRPSRPS
jgi:Arc/MetJ family transcription regulator